MTDFSEWPKSAPDTRPKERVSAKVFYFGRTWDGGNEADPGMKIGFETDDKIIELKLDHHNVVILELATSRHLSLFQASGSAGTPASAAENPMTESNSPERKAAAADVGCPKTEIS